MYILVIVDGGSIDNMMSFTDHDEAVSAADDAAAEFDQDANLGEVAVYDLNIKTGEMKSIYVPEIKDDEEEEDDEAVEEE